MAHPRCRCSGGFRSLPHIGAVESGYVTAMHLPVLARSGVPFQFVYTVVGGTADTKSSPFHRWRLISDTAPSHAAISMARPPPPIIRTPLTAEMGASYTIQLLR